VGDGGVSRRGGDDTNPNVNGPDETSFRSRLAASGYLVDDELARLLSVAVGLDRPLLVEGPAGVGKTALALALARVLGRPLVRLQCYEGIDQSQALYDWDYARQLADAARDTAAPLFSDAYLLPRPLLTALTAPGGAVLLVDEIDRADEGFEAFLLETLAEGQVTIPEMGTVVRAGPVAVVLTSNRTRSLSDALRRRCLYWLMDWPARTREESIVRMHHPHTAPGLVEEIVRVVRVLRGWDLVKPPGLAETLDLTAAMAWLGWDALDAPRLKALLGTVLKDALDWAAVEPRLLELWESG
jgi:MoxR-like ATPase